MAISLKFLLKLFPDGIAFSCFGILPTQSQLLNNFVKVTCEFNMKLSILYEQTWMELKLTGLEKNLFSGMYLVLFGSFQTWNSLSWKFNNTALILTTSNITSYWLKYFKISDSIIVKSEIRKDGLSFLASSESCSPVVLGKNIPSKHLKLHGEKETELLQLLNLL